MRVDGYRVYVISHLMDHKLGHCLSKKIFKFFFYINLGTGDLVILYLIKFFLLFNFFIYYNLAFATGYHGTIGLHDSRQSQHHDIVKQTL